MKEENFIVFEKNRKDYKTRGYKNLNCDSFFQEYNNNDNERDNKKQEWWKEEKPKDIPVFYANFEEHDGSKFYKTTNYVKNKILEILFPEEPIHNIENSDIKMPQTMVVIKNHICYNHCDNNIKRSIL